MEEMYSEMYVVNEICLVTGAGENAVIDAEFPILMNNIVSVHSNKREALNAVDIQITMDSHTHESCLILNKGYCRMVKYQGVSNGRNLNYCKIYTVTNARDNDDNIMKY